MFAIRTSYHFFKKRPPLLYIAKAAIVTTRANFDEDLFLVWSFENCSLKTGSIKKTGERDSGDQIWCGTVRPFATSFIH